MTTNAEQIRRSDFLREQVGRLLFEEFERADPSKEGMTSWQNHNVHFRYVFESVAIEFLQRLGAEFDLNKQCNK